MEVKEFEISVPWGQISAKAWGDDKNKLVLMLHGTNDNAGSFDRLIPYLRNNFYYVCLDLPGHGKSSHFPENACVQNINHVFAVKIAIESFRRKKIILLGHSLGAQILCFLTQLYPKIVEKLILIEAVCFPPISIEKFRDVMSDYIMNTINILKKSSTRKVPTYTYEKALNMTMESRFNGKLTKEAAEALLKRSLKQVGDNQYIIVNDFRNRLENDVTFLSMDFVVNLFKKHNILCPVLFIFAKNSYPFQELYKHVLSAIQKGNKKCVIKELDGEHDVHNNSPEIVAPVINEFLDKLYSNL